VGVLTSKASFFFLLACSDSASADLSKQAGIILRKYTPPDSNDELAGGLAQPIPNIRFANE
jgi:hypothetical protein